MILMGCDAKKVFDFAKHVSVFCTAYKVVYRIGLVFREFSWAECMV